MRKTNRAYSLEINSDAKKKLARLSDRESTTETAMLGALATWLAEQDEFVQSAVLRWHPSSASNDAPALILQRVVSTNKSVVRRPSKRV